MPIEDASLKAHPPSALPRGTRLGEFELRHVLGVGGFGIVYLAFDHALEREVAVKEYLPATLVGRTETLHVTLRSQSDAETFALGLKSFVNEARLLAHFDHPSLLKVLRFWEANGTAYMAMPVLRGHTLKEVRLDMAQPPDEAWMRTLLDPLLGAIERLHNEGVFHRDIAPDNIQIEPDGRPVLLDFGAARRVIGDKSQSLTAILKPAYAPIEQYAEAGSVKQGPWTDLYSLGATLHYVLLARPPSPATARAVHDHLPPLASQNLPGCSAEFLNLIDWMLAPRPADRPQSVAALRDVLAGRAPAPKRRVVEPPVDGPWERTLIHVPPGASRASGADVDAGTAHATTQVLPTRELPASALKSVSANGVASPRPDRSNPPDITASPSARPSRRLPVLLGLTALVVAGAAVGLGFGLQSGGAALPHSAAPAANAALVAANVPSVAVSVAEPAAALAPGLSTPLMAASTQPKAAVVTPPLADKRPPPRTGAALVAPVPNPFGAAPVPAMPAPAAVQFEPAPPARVQATEPAPAAVPAGPLPKPVATGPEAVCSGRNPLAYFVCMERECLRFEIDSKKHADCTKWRSGRASDRSVD